jgi:hypothetical protein
MRDQRREKFRGLDRFDTTTRTDRMGGHDGVSTQAARAIEKSIARFHFSDCQQAVAAAGLHRRDTMVCHIGVKAITPLCVDQAQSISVDHECTTRSVSATEEGKTVMPSHDEGTMQTRCHRSGTGNDVRVWRRCGGDKYVRRKQSLHG